MDGELSAFCPRYHRAVEIVGRRWTGAIVRAMLAGRTRFGEIVDAVPGLSDRLLSERLKELEAEGILDRLVTPSTPVKVEYRLTDKGRALVPVVEAVSHWADRWMPAEAQAEAGSAPFCEEESTA
ncbi:MAG: winged helix-turn-helix transcriptional regulator [Actinomycetota bacterium]|nr:winged helix-turn-helix transcriptional regulator [Actinomycetota bacterium]